MLLVSCKFSGSSILQFSRIYLVECNPNNSVISPRTTLGANFFTFNVFFPKFLCLFGFSSKLLRFFPFSSCVIVGFALEFFTLSKTKVWVSVKDLIISSLDLSSFLRNSIFSFSSKERSFWIVSNIFDSWFIFSETEFIFLLTSENSQSM